MTNSKSTQSIYVIGFPKSGNTWLTRLLADCLQSRVSVSLNDDDHIEIASSVNSQLDIPVATDFTIWKAHLLPSILMQIRNENITKAVYIYRDFRDIVISAFFYHHSRICETELYQNKTMSLKNFFQLLTELLISRKRNQQKDIGSLADYMLYCYKGSPKRLLYKHTVSISKTWSDEVGAWSNHITTWLNFKKNNLNSKIVFISYEKLLSDTTITLKKIIDGMGLVLPSEEHLESTVRRQSFKEQKKFFEENSDENLPSGKKFNIRFLRKGVAGDWKNFFTGGMGEIVEKYHGEMLLNLGYTNKANWYESLP